MKKIGLAALAGAAMLAWSGSAYAEKPASPGCFGQDRAFYIHQFQQSDVAPGASEWGQIASERGSTNGDQNRAYRASAACGTTPGANKNNVP
jgi:hypothetical protein